MEYTFYSSPGYMGKFEDRLRKPSWTAILRLASPWSIHSKALPAIYGQIRRWLKPSWTAIFTAGLNMELHSKALIVIWANLKIANAILDCHLYVSPHRDVYIPLISSLYWQIRRLLKPPWTAIFTARFTMSIPSIALPVIWANLKIAKATLDRHLYVSPHHGVYILLLSPLYGQIRRSLKKIKLDRHLYGSPHHGVTFYSSLRYMAKFEDR